jgi:hypothetical protein
VPLISVLIAVVLSSTSACDFGMTDRELRLDSRNVRVTIENLTAQTYTISFAGDGANGNALIQPFTTVRQEFEHHPPRPGPFAPRAGDRAWSLGLGQAALGPQGEWLGTHGPATIVARGHEPLITPTVDLQVRIGEDGISWRLLSSGQ